MTDKQHWPVAIVAIHWLSALTVFGLFALGLWMVDLTYYSEWYRTAPDWHKSIGLILASVTVVRLLVRSTRSAPHPLTMGWQARAAGIAHSLLYLGLITLFASGYLISTADGRGIAVFGWITIPSMGAFIENQEDLAGDIHAVAAWTLIGLVTLHAGAALKHHFFDKDRTLVRMLRPH